MNTKHLVGIFAGLAMSVATSTVGAAAFEPAQYIDGTVMAIDHQARTVTVGDKAYGVIGVMPDLRAGERVTVTYLNEDGKLVGWFKSIDLQS